jgi:DNA-binding transcriptional MerR regulator
MARNPQKRSGATLTTGDLARLAEIPQQTLISWDRSGVLRARARPGRRSTSRAPRRYDEDGLIAALFARDVSQMGFKGDRLKQMIQLVQSGDRKRLERAAVFSYRTGPGMMKHVFSQDAADEDDRRWIDYLRQSGTLIDEPASLWTICEYLRPQARHLIRHPSPLRTAERLMPAIEQEDKT